MWCSKCNCEMESVNKARVQSEEKRGGKKVTVVYEEENFRCPHKETTKKVMVEIIEHTQ